MHVWRVPNDPTLSGRVVVTWGESKREAYEMLHRIMVRRERRRLGEVKRAEHRRG
jgi:hypothetical protein